MGDINVSIVNVSTQIDTSAFGRALILSTTVSHNYTEYNIASGLSDIVGTFPTNTVVYQIAEAYRNAGGQRLAIAGTVSTTPADLTTFLDTVIAVNDSWVYLLCEDDTEAISQALSAWAQTNFKQFNAQIDTTGAVPYNTAESTAAFSTLIDQKLAGAATGYLASNTPGSYTLKFKQLNGIVVDPTYSRTIQDTLNTNRINAYVNRNSNSELLNSFQVDGSYTDEYVANLYIRSLVSQEINALLHSGQFAKIPFTNRGIAQIQSAISNALTTAFGSGAIAGLDENENEPNFEVPRLTVSDIPASDRRARRLTGLTFSYVRSGAIHSVTVQGVAL